MKTYIALLRGINVGGHKKLPMAELRKLCASIGFIDTKTYIQSGNIVFRSGEIPKKTSKDLGDAITKQFGFETSIVIRPISRITAAAVAFPYDTSDHKKAHIVFLDGKPKQEAVERLMKLDFSPDQICVDETEVYCHLPNGVLDSRIDFKKMERLLGVAGTARNWRTVQKVIDLAAEMES